MTVRRPPPRYRVIPGRRVSEVLPAGRPLPAKMLFQPAAPPLAEAIRRRKEVRAATVATVAGTPEA